MEQDLWDREQAQAAAEGRALPEQALEPVPPDSAVQDGATRPGAVAEAALSAADAVRDSV